MNPGPFAFQEHSSFHYFENGNELYEYSSDSSEEYKEVSGSQSDDDLQSDSQMKTGKSTFPQSASSLNDFSYSQVTIDKVKKIERDLDFNDAISMVFLLFDDTELALQTIRIMIEAGPKKYSKQILQDWARITEHWNRKLVEALAIVQNYKILNKLGFEEEKIDKHFFPSRDTTLFLSRPKKMLYQVCQSLHKQHAFNMIKLIRIRYKERFSNDITLDADPRNLEFHMLFWISRGFMRIEEEVCLDNLINELKVTGKYAKLISDIESMTRSVNKAKDTSYEEKITPISKVDEDNFYKINDPKNVGLCVILNMAKFKGRVETHKRFQGLHIRSDLDDREGSDIDVKRLKHTFNNLLKFKVVRKDDICHYDMEHEIKNTIIEHFDQETHSVLFLVILSHGDSGVIFAANGIAVKIEDIKSYVTSCDQLRGIPKVIIIQACQGKLPLCGQNELAGATCLPDDDDKDGVSDYADSCLDGPQQNGSAILAGRYADLMLCLATVEGFGAVRSKQDGTKYIKTLCRILKEFHKKEHFMDMMTRVHRIMNGLRMEVKVNGHKYTDVYQTPKLDSTLCKLLRLYVR